MITLSLITTNLKTVEFSSERQYFALIIFSLPLDTISKVPCNCETCVGRISRTVHDAWFTRPRTVVHRERASYNYTASYRLLSVYEPCITSYKFLEYNKKLNYLYTVCPEMPWKVWTYRALDREIVFTDNTCRADQHFPSPYLWCRETMKIYLARNIISQN